MLLVFLQHCGMLIPVLIYYCQCDQCGRFEAGTPVATDIALHRCLVLFGKRVPVALKLFLLALAIFDDITPSSLFPVLFNGVSGFSAAIFCAGDCPSFFLTALQCDHHPLFADWHALGSVCCMGCASHPCRCIVGTDDRWRGS